MTTRRGTPFIVVFQFRRAEAEVVVRAQDVGYAVQLWTQAVVGDDYETRELSRFNDPEEFDREVQRIKAQYLEDGWTLTAAPARSRKAGRVDT